MSRGQRRGRRQSGQTQAELEGKIPGGPVAPELRRHASIKTEVIATDKAGFPLIVRQEVRNRFMRMQEEGVLTLAEATAALRLRTLADNYYQGITGAYQMRVDGSSRPGESMTSKLQMAQEVNGALRYLTPTLRRVAVAFILDGIVPHMGNTFTSIGANILPREHVTRQLVAGKALVVATCRELAVYWKTESDFEFDVTKGITGVKMQHIRKIDNPPQGASLHEAREIKADQGGG